MRILSAAGICVLVAACEPSPEPVDLFGYERLRAELGDATPDGTGVAVHLVEGSVEIIETVDGVETSVGSGFAPDVAELEFLGKNIEVRPSVFARPSGHATSVGKKLFGNATSTSPGIVDVHAFESMTWIGSVLNLGRARLPEAYAARVANHSWVGTADHPELPGTRNVEVLRRIDWLVEADESIQVAGFNGNPGSPLLSAAWNAISVRDVGGAHQADSAPVGREDYPDGRTRPDIVVPESNPSSATARVASAAALLIEAAHAAAADHSTARPAPTRAGALIFNAERSEVIKAALMAGADRGSPDSDRVAGIPDYRAVVGERTANGLDRRHGAGLLDIYESHRIVTGPEHDSDEDRSGEGVAVADSGFDFDASFGGAGGSNSSANYRIAAAPHDRDLVVALVWNARAAAGPRLRFDEPTRIFDLDLALYELRDDRETLGVVASRSRVDNSEHITVRLESGRDYALRVEAGPDQAPFDWDFALAWRIEPPPAGGK